MINHPLYQKIKADIEYCKANPPDPDPEDDALIPMTSCASTKMLKIAEIMSSLYSEEQHKKLSVVVFGGDYGEAVMYCDNTNTNFRLVVHCSSNEDKTTLFFIAHKPKEFPWHNYHCLFFDGIEEDLMWIVEYGENK